MNSQFQTPTQGLNQTRLAVFLLAALTLWAASAKAPFPLLLGERLFPGTGFLWILLFAAYGSVLGGLLHGRGSNPIRSRLWLFFSILFFGQLALGLAGWTIFLMTGKLHLPLPALILAGPLYRGGGYFMPMLLGASLILVGPAWCSYLCYFGALDDRCARMAEKGAPLPTGWRHVRIGILIASLFLPLLLRTSGVDWPIALGLAVAFGAAGLCIMATLSRRTGSMVHCTTWCPVGLLNNLIGRLLPWRIRIDPACDRCGACTKACRYNALTLEDLKRNRPGLTCSLCGDCLPACRRAHLSYAFPGLSPERARQVFIVLVVSLHTIFLAVARI